MKKKYIFIHVRKTAGTSFRASLRKNFEDSKYCPIQSQIDLHRKYPIEKRADFLNDYDLIAGHYFCIGQILSLSNYSIFMFFRNPIDRVISAYNHIKNSKKDRLNQKLKDKSFREALNYEGANLEMVNSQFKYLIRNFGGPNYNLLENEIESKYSYEKHFPLLINMLEKIEYIGITELFNTSIKLFEKQNYDNLDFGKEKILNKKVTANGLKFHTMKSEEITELLKLNFLDMEVYKAALFVFNKRLSKFIEDKNY